jgi:protein SCO1
MRMSAAMGSLGYKRIAGVALLFAAAACALAAFFLAHGPPGSDAWGGRVSHDDHVPLAVLNQSLLRLEPGEPLALPALVAADGQALAPERLTGRWSVVFFGFTACPEVCPTTLRTLAAVSRDPASGVPSGATQIVFVSVDPDADTPERVRAYLENFDRRILGLTGSHEAIGRFTAAAGAGYQARSAGNDHSSSLFVLDPAGRLAGILLAPGDPARIVADLKALRGRDG